MTRRRDSRGASVVEFSLIMPVFVGVIGLAFFLAYVYEVRSDLQRTAQRAATYAANQCDPIGRQASGCSTLNHPDTTATVAFADTAFPKAAFQAGDASCSFNGDPVLCLSYTNPDDTTATVYSSPAPNLQAEVTVRYRFDSPFSPFLRMIGLDGLVDLKGHGRATVE